MIRKIKGFSLIELLVVVGIIGIVATIILPPLNDARSKAKNAQIVASLSALESAIDIAKYPGSLENLCFDFESGGELASVRTSVEEAGGIWNCDSTVDTYRIFVKLNQDVIASHSITKTAHAESDPHDFGNYYCVNYEGEKTFTHWPGTHLSYPSCNDIDYTDVPQDPAPTPEPTPDPDPETDPEPPTTTCTNPDKVLICHFDNSICVSQSAKKGHLKHGDTEGAC